jgi:hypothetical protein
MVDCVGHGQWKWEAGVEGVRRGQRVRIRPVEEAESDASKMPAPPEKAGLATERQPKSREIPHLRKPTTSRERGGKKKHRLAAFGMTGGRTEVESDAGPSRLRVNRMPVLPQKAGLAKERQPNGREISSREERGMPRSLSAQADHLAPQCFGAGRSEVGRKSIGLLRSE